MLTMIDRLVFNTSFFLGKMRRHYHFIFLSINYWYERERSTLFHSISYDNYVVIGDNCTSQNGRGTRTFTV